MTGASPQPDVRRVLVLAHTGRDEARGVARACCKALTSHGIVVRLLAHEARDLELEPESCSPAIELTDSESVASRDCELTLVIARFGYSTFGRPDTAEPRETETKRLPFSID